MAFETSSLVNGQWTTRTMGLDAVLQHYNQEDKEARMAHVEVEQAPTLGLLTQTVIRSPLAHWILPVRLRSQESNDVVFIGDDFVQVKELRPDRQLWDVIRKENFGARIRNARVMGSLKGFNSENTDGFGSQEIKDEDDDVLMDATPNLEHHAQRDGSVLSPQCILLQLDTGDSVFLMLQRTKTGSLGFVSSVCKRVPKPMLGLQPGTHLAVDPSSRYMVVGCSESLFVIYALRPREEISLQYQRGLPIQPIEEQNSKVINPGGVILKLEFLYPAADDEAHVVLLVVIVKKGRTRMMLYEWETGMELSEIRPNTPRGHGLAPDCQMPLLLIPLTIKSSFLLIFEDSVKVCQRFLEGTPILTDVNPFTTSNPTTNVHTGKSNPLWVAWARSERMDYYTSKGHEDIYLVREDGVLKLLEIDASSDAVVRTGVNVGPLGNNCGTALASLIYNTYKTYGGGGDLLVTGGTSCGGGSYLVQARKIPTFVEPIQNWSPSVDLATTFKPRVSEPAKEAVGIHRRREVVAKPDRIFSCVGRGSTGAVAEIRYGFEAKLGLEVDYPTLILEAWALCPSFNSGGDDDGSLFLLSLPDRSAVLRLSGDASAITDDEENTKFDLRYRTITASMQRGHTIQVTEQSIVIIDGDLSHHIYEGEEVLRLEDGENGVVLGLGEIIKGAVIHEDFVLFTTEFDDSTFLQVLRLNDTSGIETSENSLIRSPPVVHTIGRHIPQVTSVGVCHMAQNTYAITAEKTGHSALLKFTPIDGTESHSMGIPTTYCEKAIDIGDITSMAVSYQRPGLLTLLCGTRNGFVLTVVIDNASLQAESFGYTRFGLNEAMVTKDAHSGSKDLYFVVCDSKVYGLSPGLRREDIHQVWLTDVARPELNQPEINSIARLRPNLSGGKDGGLLMVAGHQLLLASFSTQGKTVPRYLPVKGTPTRLLYSHTLQVLIVAAIVEGKTTLLLIDPDTGDDLCVPWDMKHREQLNFPKYLGGTNETIFHLLEWSHVKDNQTFHFIIVCTNSGRFLIMKPIQYEDERGTKSGRPKIKVYTNHSWKRDNPMYSVVGLPSGLVWCCGEKLHYEVLLRNKNFKCMATYDLLSPATSLVHEDGVIYVLTSCHSLEILKLTEDSNGNFKFVKTHVDEVARNTLHHGIVERGLEKPIHLISDKHSSVVGSWATHDTKADILETIFEAELAHSILKFRLSKCRPVWDSSWKTPFSQFLVEDTPDTLGLSINGAVSHFTVVKFEAWRFLRFFINLALRSPEVCEFTYKDGEIPLEPPRTPKLMMHIDGDILKRCLEGGHLERLLDMGVGSPEAQEKFEKFYEIIQALHKGTLEKNADHAVYVEQAYQDLLFFLRPVL
ncbi:hypothetical protein HYFRA_00002491 [Hymenoscyphus fraxineus]|uniref:RSE1/DDB1/CPSF1 first beta-propeller domain-containing protein n=1 Tax=Hymenoscyphus fraxineus TaxID=746836 RepID=A0A9N9L8B9_9HELO|nr:hypothetical protein HYFRA_00002491 [Hymenoscyphus fraxineus]